MGMYRLKEGIHHFPQKKKERMHQQITTKRTDLLCDYVNFKMVDKMRILIYNLKRVLDHKFWKGVIQAKKNFVKWSLIYKVNNGNNTLFGKDIWAGDIPLKLEFPSSLAEPRSGHPGPVAGLSWVPG